MSVIPICLICFATMFIVFGVFLIPLPMIIAASLARHWYLDISTRAPDNAMIFARIFIFTGWLSLILVRCFANCALFTQEGGGLIGFILLMVSAQILLIGAAILLLARFWQRIVRLIDRLSVPKELL